MLSRDDIEGAVGSLAYACDGQQVGTVTQIYLDEHDRPAWIALDTDLFASAEVYLPADGAMLDADGRLRLPVTQKQIDTAPRIDLEAPLTPQTQRRLREHFEQPPSTAWVAPRGGARGRTGGGPDVDPIE